MNDATGGRTQVTGLVAAGTIAAVLLFFTGPLRYVPIPALGAVLVNSRALRAIYAIDRREFALSVVATLGVVAIGAIHAILFAVALATLRFVRLTARPKVEIHGKVEGLPGFHSIERHPEASTIPGLLLFRFNAPIVFFNAPYFKRELLAAVDSAGHESAPTNEASAIDMLPVTLVDSTGLYTAQEVAAELNRRGATFTAAGRQTEWRVWSKSRSLPEGFHRTKIFPTLRAAVKAYLGREGDVADVVGDASSA